MDNATSGVLVKMIIMIMLTYFLAIQVHSVPPFSSLDDYTDPPDDHDVLSSLPPLLDTIITPICSSDDVHHLSSHDQPILTPISVNPWPQLLGKNVKEAAMEVQKAIPSATITVRKIGSPSLQVLRNKGGKVIVTIYTDNNDIVTHIMVWGQTIVKKN